MVTEREINIFAVIEVIWERGKKILMITVVTMFLAMLISLTIANRYTSTATLIMQKSKLGERTMQNPAMPMQSYFEIIQADEILWQVIQSYDLDEKPYRLRYPKELRDRLTIVSFGESANIGIEVTLEDPQIAASVANALATHAIEKNQFLIEKEKEVSQSKITEETNHIKERLDRYQAEYLELLKKNNLPIVRNNLDTNLTLLTTLRQEKQTLDLSIAELQKSIEYFEDLFFDPGFERHPDFQKLTSVKTSIFEDVAALETIKDSSPPMRVRDLVDLSVSEEQVNAGYFNLVQEYSKLQVDLPSQMEKRDRTAQRIEELEEIVEEQQRRIHEMEVEEQEAKANYDRELEVYGGVYKEWGWAGSNIYQERQELILAHHAIPVEKKVFPRRTLMIALAGLGAFLVALLFFLLVDLYGLMQTGVSKKLQMDQEESQGGSA